MAPSVDLPLPEESLPLRQAPSKAVPQSLASSPPSSSPAPSPPQSLKPKLPSYVDGIQPTIQVQGVNNLPIPTPTRARFEKAGIDLSAGYPSYPKKPIYVEDAYLRNPDDRTYVDPGTRADKDKKALFGAATKVTHLTKHIGTEIVGLQLKDLTPQQKDELALLIAERSVVFFRDQDLSPQQQVELGEWYGDIDYHATLPHVPGVPGAQVVWPDLQRTWKKADFRHPGGNARWHSDEVHGKYPAGITHLHNETVPDIGGDTLWASGYSAYEKLSPAFREFIDGKSAVYVSAHTYRSRTNPDDTGLVPIERVHPLVRVHPVTGWKSLYLNRALTSRIVGLDRKESDLVLAYLNDVYEGSPDIQLRWKWSPRTSALWDNRITIHNVSWDYEGEEPRHGTRVISLAEQPFFAPDAPTRRQALGLGD